MAALCPTSEDPELATLMEAGTPDHPELSCPHPEDPADPGIPTAEIAAW